MAMAGPSYLYLSLLLVLVVAPHLSRSDDPNVEMSPEFNLFGTQILNITVHNILKSWLGEVLDLVETKAGIPEAIFEAPEGAFKRYYLNLNDKRLLQLVLCYPDGSKSICTRLMFTLNSLYLIGFANSKDDWFALKGYSHVMPTATELTFSPDYKDLITTLQGQTTGKKFTNLAVGTVPLVEAVSTLRTTDVSDPKVPLAVALFSVTVAESLRLAPYRIKIGAILEDETTEYLDETYREYTLNWLRVSKMLWCSTHGLQLKAKDIRDLDKIGITDMSTARDFVAILKYPKDYKPADPASCRRG